MSHEFVYLASASARRRELLQQIGVSFRLLSSELDETPLRGETAAAYVSRLAAAKSETGWQCKRDAVGAPVLAADTAVVLDGRILGKPLHREDAQNMLLGLSGRTHEVLTAVALRSVAGAEVKISRSWVTFRDIDAPEAALYWDSGEPRDKAGAYAIQGYAAIFITDLKGSYSGVMGLPLFETAELLTGAGVEHWRSGSGAP